MTEDLGLDGITSQGIVYRSLTTILAFAHDGGTSRFYAYPSHF